MVLWSLYMFIVCLNLGIWILDTDRLRVECEGGMRVECQVFESV